MLSSEQEQYAREKFGEPQQVRIPRRGERDLGFTGWEIGKSEGEGGFNRLAVTIYVTTKGNYVTRIDRFPRLKTSSPTEAESTSIAAAHYVAVDALKWLEDDNGSSLGSASKAAWEQACRAWPELADHEMETV